MTDKHAGRTQSRRPVDDRRFVGPSGAVFVPHSLIDEVTIARNVEAGEWTPVEPRPVKKAAPAPPKK